MSKFQNWLFNQVHGKKLIYNTCWEDPRCDRKLLQLQPDSEVVMITSAGDNALDYLLDNPASIHTVDMNYRQNALLELKRSILQKTDPSTLFAFFGRGQVPLVREVYHRDLRTYLPEYAQKYWDKHISYFDNKGFRKSFYYRGASGTLAYFCKNYLKLEKSVERNVQLLFNSRTLQEQIENYYAIEQKIFNPFISKLLNNHFTMCLAGVPKAQQTLIRQDFSGGNVAYIQECFRRIFTQLEIKDNYFYQVYFNGQYTESCCPEYLKSENFHTLQNRQNRIQTHTSTLSKFLQQNPGTYSHYILLDHQDWLAAHDVPALEEEWKLMLKNSRPGTKILLRSASAQVDFFPSFVKQRVTFDESLTKKMHLKDRVGTYASVYLGVVTTDNHDI